MSDDHPLDAEIENETSDDDADEGTQFKQEWALAPTDSENDDDFTIEQRQRMMDIACQEIVIKENKRIGAKINKGQPSASSSGIPYFQERPEVPEVAKKTTRPMSTPPNNKT